MISREPYIYAAPEHLVIANVTRTGFELKIVCFLLAFSIQRV
jgi:hypothetical protein